MTDAVNKVTWEDIVKAKGGTIFVDKFDEGIRFIIMKGGASLCAYVGIPKDHILAGFGYDDLPIEAHGGLTCAYESVKEFPEGFYWYGWDYAHSGDYCTYNDTSPVLSSMSRIHEKKWLVKDVEEDSWNTLYQFKSLVKLAERIAEKSKQSK